MKIKKGFFIYSEKYERTIIRCSSKRIALNAMCEKCGVRVDWLTLEEVSAITNQKIEEIRLNKNDDFDFLEMNDGRLLICKNSVFKDEKG
jgi:hypothetical protein